MKNTKPVRYSENDAFIPLTMGYEAVVDAEDAALLSQYNWRAYVRKWAVYAVREEPIGNGKYRSVRMHRQIMGSPEGLEVDHKDHDGLNNRRSNLRACTVGQNRRNQRISSANTVGLKGVVWNKAKKKYQAGIKVNGKRINLGSFDDKNIAHKAYCEASAKYHGEYSCTG